MKIVNIDGQELENNILEIIKENSNYYLKKPRVDVILNNVMVNSKYTVLSEGDIIEFTYNGENNKYYVLDEEDDMSSINETKVIMPFIIPQYQMYPENTGVLGILYAHNNYKEWLFDNCNLIWAYKWIWSKEYWCDFVPIDNTVKIEDALIIDKIDVNNEFMSDEQQIINFFEDKLIDSYIFVALDMWAVSGWWKSDDEKFHINHPVLVYGYDKKSKLVYCADFLKSKYCKYTLTYDQFVGACIGGYYGGNQIVQIWKYNDIILKYNINTFKINVSDFIFSKNTLKNNFLSLGAYCNVLYGVDAIEKMCREIQGRIDVKRFWDLRHIHLIKVSIQVLEEMIIYFSEKGEILYNEKTLLIENVENTLAKISRIEIFLIKYLIKSKINKCDKENDSKLDDMLNDITELYALVFESLNKNMSLYEKYKIRRKWDLIKDNEKVDIREIDEKNSVHTGYFEYLIEVFEQHNNKNNSDFVNEKIKGCKKNIIVSDYYQNVFPFEIEEDGFACLGKKIAFRNPSSKSEKIYYYDENDRVVVIDYLSSIRERKYFVYKYDKNQIVRTKYKQKDDGLFIENIKMQVIDNNITYVYSFKPEKNERKLDVYIIEEEKCIESMRYRCNDLNLPIDKWINKKWAERKKYVYSNNGELLQIFIYDYDDNRKMIYSNFNKECGDFTNLNMQLEEKTIADQFCGTLHIQANVCNEKLYIKYKSKSHKVIFTSDNREVDDLSFSFLEEYDLEDEVANRFNILFAIEIYKHMKVNDIEIVYYFDEHKIDVSDGTFIYKCRI